MSDARKCERCGTEVEAGALFCSRCGQDMTLVGDDTPTLEVTTAGTPVHPVRSTMRQALRDATLGEYEILSELGRGGMATVFLAHDIALDRKVAIKVMSPHLLEGEGMAERFKLEARTAAQLSHPHIIPIYAVKETAETLFFVMKYVEGRGLDAVVKRTGPLPIPMARDILTKVGSALGYAHRRDVVHRDIKPANIMIDEEGTPVVTDFGIAKVAEAKGLTITGTTIGTPSYMSPEQCEAKEVTGASDQYSLGIVAFEMLTGKLPFEGDSAVNTMYKHCHEPLPPLEDFRPDCPPELRETVERMTAKKPADRWPSLEAAVRKLNNDPTPTSVDPIRSHLMELVKEGDADELLARLSDPSGPVTSRSAGPGAARATPTPARSRRGLVAALATVAVVGVGGTLAVIQPWAGAASPAGADPVAGQTADGGTPAARPPTGGDDVALAASPGGDATSTTGDDDAAAQDGEPETPAPDVTEPARPDGQPAGRGTTPPARTVRSVRVTGSPDRLEPGGTVRLTASALDADGSPIPGTRVLWSSTDERVARVDASGSVTALTPGRAVLTASAGGVSGSVTVTVVETAVASLAVEPATLELTVGDEAVVGAAARAADGSALPGRGVTWRSSNESVARLGDAGRVIAAGPGTATITATSEGASADVDVTVRVATAAAVEAVVESYRQALESRDVARVRQVYPDMTTARERQLDEALSDMEGLRVDYTIDSIDERDGVAVATVSTTWRFRGGGRDQVVPQPLVFTFARTETSWRVTAIQ